MPAGLAPHGDFSDFHRTLGIASLFRGDFSIDWLVDLMIGKKASHILAILEQGVDQGVLTRKAPGCYGFTSPRTRTESMSHLSSDEQKQLHAHISDILMRELPDDAEKAHAMAHHLIHVTNDAERCRYLAKAGDLHLEEFRTEEALHCYLKVLEDLALSPGEAEDLLFSETAIKYSKLSTARHDTAKVLDILQSALERAEKWNMEGARAILKMHMAKNEWLRSRYTKALAHFEEGWSLAKELSDPKIMRSATNFSTFFLFWQGRFREAIQTYEKSVPNIEKYPRGGFPLLAVITVGYCYAQIGQVTQGLGMLDSIRAQCVKEGNQYLAAYTAGNIGNILLDIGRVDDAVPFLDDAKREALEAHNDWVAITVKISLAYLSYLKGRSRQALKYLSEFLQQTKKVQATVYLYPYLMELGLAMREGKLPEIKGLDLEKEIQEQIKRKNIFLKGVAFRCRARLWQLEGREDDKILHCLEASERWLEESGSLVEISKTRLAKAMQHLAAGREEKAKELVQIVRQSGTSFSDALLPDDLLSLVKDRPLGENLLKEILSLGQQVVTIRDYKDLVQHIISTVNRVTGAERGAIFWYSDDAEPPELKLRASKNLTSDQIEHPGFRSSMAMIRQVAAAGKGRVLGAGTDEQSGARTNEIVRSRICVPMILREKTVGVLYHDNRLLSSAFSESDLELLSYFAALAAFAMDNAVAYEEINRLNDKLSEENLYYKEEHLQTLHFEDIVGESLGIKRVLAQIDQVTGTDATVMIVGETGVGKELVARAIHRHSPRRDKPFIRVHCSALPETLIPSELFGHEKGAFTGASRQRIGRFELADGGTLFLDEIGDISQDIQVKLLRVLQTKEFERVGGSETLKSDFRLVAATNRDLEKMIKTGRFREDLFYRLAVFPIQVPPLRERVQDIPLLAYYFLRIYSKKLAKEVTKIPGSEMRKLIHYHWPGNIRELENVLERGIILSSSSVFRVPELGGGHGEVLSEEGGVTLKENERRHILWALDKTGWKVRGTGGAAELLDLPASTLAFRMRKLGIERPGKSPR
ncbi:MAG: sigma 54-interacting transcriptional regulator [Desulfomonilaceae bacterium]|nr:sigma 54-interacting transcriptional regulator [Desulfomonilaceae bacterium]